METLSVIIPAFRAEKYLEEAVRSVRGQSWSGAVEVVILDDGSDDGTLALARELGDVVRTKERGGAASARNLGLRAAGGEFLLLLDADDRLAPGALEGLYAAFRARPELTVCFGRARDFVSPELTQEQRKGLRVREGSYGGVLPGCALLRRTVFDTVGLFDESLNSGETVAWMMKLRESALPAASLELVTLERRLHLSNTGRVDPKQEMRNYAAILRKRMGGT